MIRIVIRPKKKKNKDKIAPVPKQDIRKIRASRGKASSSLISRLTTE
jgi:hypothetical protein